MTSGWFSAFRKQKAAQIARPWILVPSDADQRVTTTVVPTETR
jgi:hypothetical protein